MLFSDDVWAVYGIVTPPSPPPRKDTLRIIPTNPHNTNDNHKPLLTPRTTTPQQNTTTNKPRTPHTPLALTLSITITLVLVLLVALLAVALCFVRKRRRERGMRRAVEEVERGEVERKGGRRDGDEQGERMVLESRVSIVVQEEDEDEEEDDDGGSEGGVGGDGGFGEERGRYGVSLRRRE